MGDYDAKRHDINSCIYIYCIYNMYIYIPTAFGPTFVDNGRRTQLG
jgi:hypothetical protein